MPKWGYTITDLDPEKSVKASGRELSISHKAAREVCQTIKGMTLDQAKNRLNKAIQKNLKVLEGAEANAEFKGLDPERLKIIHAAAYPGMKIKRYQMRAFGRSTPKIQTLTHVELVL